MASKCEWLTLCLKDGKFKVLRKLIPETLFYSTNLPLVKIFVDQKTFLPEQPDLVLTYLVPGRVTYRYGRGGHIVPAIAPRVSAVSFLYSLIHYSYYPLYVLDKCSLQPMTRLYPEELRYVSTKLLGSTSYECFELREVHPRAFMPWDLSDPNTTREFGKFAYSIGKGSMYDALGFLKRRRVDVVNQLSSKTVAYPRTGTFLQEGQCLPHYHQNLVYVPYTMEYCVNSNLTRYVYAEDMKISYRPVKNPTEHTLSERSPLKRYTITMSRILSRDADAKRFSVIGYKIDNTSSLKLTFASEMVEKALAELLEEASSWLTSKADSSCAANDSKFYAALTVCQSLRDSLLYVLLEDLYSSISRSKLKDQGSLRELTHVALLYSELERPLCEILLRGDIESALEELKGSLLSKLLELRQAFEEKDLVKTKPYIITLLYKGKGYADALKKLKKLKDKDVEKYVSDLMERFGDFVRKLSAGTAGKHWSLGLLRLVASHTYTHHVIKQVALSAGLSTEFLGEHIDVSDSGVVLSVVFENVSGGVAAIEGALKSWNLLNEDYGSPRGDVKIQNRIESLLLRLGECAIGTPEDILYARLVLPGDPVFVTPLERAEYEKLSRAFNEEVARFSKIWGLSDQKLKDEVAQLLCESDTLFARFSNHDDVLLYYILNLDYRRWSELGNLFTGVLSRVLGKREEEVRSVLIELHSYVSDSRKVKLSLLKSMNIGRVLATMKSALIRLVPRTCNPSCCMCHHNQRSCRYANPEAQRLLLNRRLLKLAALRILKTQGRVTL